MEIQSKLLVIEKQKYEYDRIINTRSADAETTHIVIPMHENWKMTLIAVECIKKFTSQPYLIWVVDNFSSAGTRKNLLEIEGVNLIFNNSKNDSFFHPWNFKPYFGSTLNGVALELVAHTIENLHGKYMFVMHNDALPVKSGWLDYLKSKISDQIKIVGVSQDQTRIQAAHNSGFLFDLNLYRQYPMSFMPHMPEYDVGDGITLMMKRMGYEMFICQNTYNHPETINYLNYDGCPEFLQQYNTDRVFNDGEELIYIHLGRGTQKHREWFRKKTRASVEEWKMFIGEYFL